MIEFGQGELLFIFRYFFLNCSGEQEKGLEFDRAVLKVRIFLDRLKREKTLRKMPFMGPKDALTR